MSLEELIPPRFEKFNFKVQHQAVVSTQLSVVNISSFLSFCGFVIVSAAADVEGLILTEPVVLRFSVVVR